MRVTLLAGIAATTTAEASDPMTSEALVTGYSGALAVAAGLLALAAAIAAATLRTRSTSEEPAHGDVNPAGTNTQSAATAGTES